MYRVYTTNKKTYILYTSQTFNIFIDRFACNRFNSKLYISNKTTLNSFIIYMSTRL